VTASRTRAPSRPERGAVIRGRQLGDVLAAVRLLARGRWLVDDLATHLGITRRTTYRLLSAMRDQGLAVDRQREGRYVYLRLGRQEVEDWLWRRPAPSSSPRRTR
jgi:DNA-binding transcriptional ArsR family regulator